MRCRCSTRRRSTPKPQRRDEPGQAACTNARGTARAARLGRAVGGRPRHRTVPHAARRRDRGREDAGDPDGRGRRRPSGGFRSARLSSRDVCPRSDRWDRRRQVEPAECARRDIGERRVGPPAHDRAARWRGCRARAVPTLRSCWTGWASRMARRTTTARMGSAMSRSSTCRTSTLSITSTASASRRSCHASTPWSG